jgi:hypothetical protein
MIISAKADIYLIIILSFKIRLKIYLQTAD